MSRLEAASRVSLPARPPASEVSSEWECLLVLSSSREVRARDLHAAGNPFGDPSRRAGGEVRGAYAKAPCPGFASVPASPGAGAEAGREEGSSYTDR